MQKKYRSLFSGGSEVLPTATNHTGYIGSAGTAFRTIAGNESRLSRLYVGKRLPHPAADRKLKDSPEDSLLSETRKKKQIVPSSWPFLKVLHSHPLELFDNLMLKSRYLVSKKDR